MLVIHYERWRMMEPKKNRYNKAYWKKKRKQEHQRTRWAKSRSGEYLRNRMSCPVDISFTEYPQDLVIPISKVQQFGVLMPEWFCGVDWANGPDFSVIDGRIVKGGE